MAAQNFDNRTLYHGDNLDFLRGMNSGSVHLIATDPPFNIEKRDRMTLSGLQDFNRREGYPLRENERNIKRGRLSRRRR